MNVEVIDSLVDKHRRAACWQLAKLLPAQLLLLVVRCVTLLPAALCHYGLKAIDHRLRGRHYAPRWLMTGSNVLSLPIVLDMFVSEASVRRRQAFLRISKILNGKDLRDELAGSFLLYLRDFNPQDSEVFEYAPFIGARETYGHRDSYVFADIIGTEEKHLPILSVANLGDGLTPMSTFCYLLLPKKHWQLTVKRLMYLAQGIIVVVPFDGTLGQIASSRNLEFAQGCLSSCRHSKMERRARSLALELSWIVEDNVLRAKTLIGTAFLDGQPYVNSTWLSLNDFRSLKTNEVGEMLRLWLSGCNNS